MKFRSFLDGPALVCGQLDGPCSAKKARRPSLLKFSGVASILTMHSRPAPSQIRRLWLAFRYPSGFGKLSDILRASIGSQMEFLLVSDSLLASDGSLSGI